MDHLIRELCQAQLERLVPLLPPDRLKLELRVAKQNTHRPGQGDQE